nr:NADH dehydrogenase subunit 4l [Travisia sanrikuensis]
MSFFLSPIYSILIIIFFLLFKLFLERNQLLSTLLILESTALTAAFFTTSQMGSPLINEAFLGLFVLCFSVCEAGIALAMLVSLTRSTGSDKLSALTSSKW